jgi:RND family efflux transporter MFP subunit
MPTSAPKSRLWLNLLIVVAVLIAALAIAFYRFRATAIVATVTRGPAVDVVTGSVVVHADKDLQDIKSEMPGRVVWIDSRQLGVPFKAGEPMLKLDSSDLERQMKQAESDFHALTERKKIERQNDPAEKIARENLTNAERRHSRGEISDDDLKSAQRALDKVETELALADFDEKQAKVSFDNAQAERKRQLEKMTIRAPMDGIMQSILVAPGALIGADSTVATFFSNVRVVIAKVGEEDVGKVKPGQPARVRFLNLPGKIFDATVATILPFADADTQRYSVYLTVQADTSELKPFSTGEATITVGQHENQPLIPRRALFNDDYVFVVKDGVVEKRKLSIGFKALNMAEVTGNLQTGEQVIVDNLDQFRDGQHVRAVAAR